MAIRAPDGAKKAQKSLSIIDTVKEFVVFGGNTNQYLVRTHEYVIF